MSLGEVQSPPRRASAGRSLRDSPSHASSPSRSPVGTSRAILSSAGNPEGVAIAVTGSPAASPTGEPSSGVEAPEEKPKSDWRRYLEGGDADIEAAVTREDPTVPLEAEAQASMAGVLARELAAEDWQLRAAAIRALGDFGEAAVPHGGEMLKSLQDDHSEVRRATTQMLGTLADSLTPSKKGRRPPKTVGGKKVGGKRFDGTVALKELAFCVGDRDADVRRAAAIALGDLGEGGADHRDTLVKLLKKDKAGFVRETSLVSLGKIGNLDAAQRKAVIGKLKDPSVATRRAALEVLGDLEGASAALIECMSDFDPTINGLAAAALGRSGGFEALNPCLVNDDWRVRRAAAIALGELELDDHKGLVRNLADKDGRVRRSAQEELKVLGVAPVKHAAVLAARLEEQDWRVRTAAVKALGDIGKAAAAHAEAVAACMAESASKVMERQQEAEKTLQRTRSAAQLQAAPLVGTPKRSQKEASPGSSKTKGSIRSGQNGTGFDRTQSMSHFDTASWSIPIELNRNVRLPDDDLPVLLAAIEALGKIGQATEEQREKLAEFLTDQNESIRRIAAEALGNLGEDSFEQREALVTCLKDHDRRVRATSAHALSKLCLEELVRKDTAVVDTLRALTVSMTDWSPDVRNSSAEAVGKVGGSETLGFCLRNRSLEVRLAAKEAIGNLGENGAPLRKTLRQIANKPNEPARVRYIATEALTKIERSMNKR